MTYVPAGTYELAGSEEIDSIKFFMFELGNQRTDYFCSKYRGEIEKKKSFRFHPDPVGREAERGGSSREQKGSAALVGNMKEGKTRRTTQTMNR